jgi:hypothetical protein
MSRFCVRLGFVLSAPLVLALVACADNPSRDFGATRDAPSENSARVLPRLSVPPVMAQRPGREGSVHAQDVSESENAAANLGAASAMPSGATGVSRGQQSLLQASGPAAPANIRARIDQDAMMQHEDQSFTEQLLFGPSPSARADGAIIQRSRPGFWSSLF